MLTNDEINEKKEKDMHFTHKPFQNVKIRRINVHDEGRC